MPEQSKLHFSKKSGFFKVQFRWATLRWPTGDPFVREGGNAAFEGARPTSLFSVVLTVFVEIFCIRRGIAMLRAVDAVRWCSSISGSIWGQLHDLARDREFERRGWASLTAAGGVGSRD